MTTWMRLSAVMFSCVDDQLYMVMTDAASIGFRFELALLYDCVPCFVS